MSLIMIDGDKCNYCNLCVEICPAHILEIKASGELPTLVRGGEAMCINCGHCIAICPCGAFSLDKMMAGDCLPITEEMIPSSGQIELFLRSRRSIRDYKQQPVPRETLAGLIDIARYAPSSHNAQPVQWLVVEDTVEVRRLAGLAADWLRLLREESPKLANVLHSDSVVKAWDAGRNAITHNAPHIIIAHTNKGFGVAGNCQIALTYMEMAAYSIGLGTCWAGMFQLAAASHPPLIEAMKLPERHQSYGTVMIGYPVHKFSNIPLRNEPNIVWR